MKYWNWIILLTLGTPIGAYGWGHTKELESTWSRARLIFPVLRDHAINYCLENHAPDRFSESSLVVEIESALEVWLEPIRLEHGHSVIVKRVDCTFPNFNLKVEIGPEGRWPQLGSYQISAWHSDHYYSLVKINTEYRYTTANTHYSIQSFSEFIGNFAREERLVLQMISKDHPQTVTDFAGQNNFDRISVFWSTYRI